MDLSNATELTPLADAARDVLRAAERAGARIFVAGAFSRDLWLWHANSIRTGRATGDLDFAVQCKDWVQFETMARMMTESGFTILDARIQHRFRHRNGTPVDLVPFGGVERADRTIAWPPDESHVMNLVGFQEVLGTIVAFRLPGDIVLPVISLSSLAALKLLAWRDRGLLAPRKDAEDLRVILANYSNTVEVERLYEEIPELFERPDFDFELAGAELVGRRLALDFGGTFLAEVRELLEIEANPEGDLRLARAMKQNDEESCRRLLEATLRGIRH